MVSLACQDRCRYPGRKFLSLYRRTTGGVAAARAAGDVVGHDSATGGAPGFRVEFPHDQHQYILDRPLWFAGGICAGAHAVSRSQPVRDVGDLAYRVSPRGCRSCFTADFRAFWPGWSISAVAVYIAAESDLDTAVALSVVLLAVSFGLLLALRLGRERLVG